ncbi:MAG: NAD(P)H-dependent glycerol-3-phosphate dehydrogenase [Ignavibacteriaceae bacterium]|nr:NAD(P)H-dependent glycerol-3-phosphate dehydrogenase [Ignavibacteriaceae bacterium]
MKITVLGAGAWGTTLALVLLDNSNSVTLWERSQQYRDYMVANSENSTYLPGVKLPPSLNISSDLIETITGRDIIICAVPSQFLRGVLNQIDYSLIKDSIFVSVSKGIEQDTTLTVTQIIQDVYKKLPASQLGVLSGPSHAEEVSKKVPTTVVSASSDSKTANTIQNIFMTDYFRVYTTGDVPGVELGGAFKNVIAIGAGIIDGIGYGDNTKAAIMTRGVAEVTRLGIAMGANPETFSGLSGIGDLIVTCMSKHSRNRYVGEKIGKGMKLQEVLKTMNAVAEGIHTSKSASDLAKKFNVETPITNEVYKILFEDKDPKLATYDLMTRDRKNENVFNL